MLITLLATLWLGFMPEPLHQWEVGTLGDSEQSHQRVEVTKERDSVLCGTVGDSRFVFPPSYTFTERVNLLERECKQLDETTSVATIGNEQNVISKGTGESQGKETATKPDGQNEQVVKPTVEQPRAEVKSSTPEPAPAPKPVVKEEPKPQPKQQVKQEVKKEEPKPVQSSSVVGNFNTSHYTAGCTGCSGITASGYDVRNTIYSPEGYRIVAASKEFAIGTKLRLTYKDGTSFVAVVLDRGGAITKGKLDVLVSSKQEAYRLGRQQVKVEIVK